MPLTAAGVRRSQRCGSSCPPLGKGFLTGTIDQSTAFTGPDIRATIPRFAEENRKANQALVDLLGAIARRKGAAPALAWLLARKPWIVPMPGTRRLERLEENIGAAQVDLTADDLAEIETAAAPCHAFALGAGLVGHPRAP